MAYQEDYRLHVMKPALYRDHPTAEPRLCVVHLIDTPSIFAGTMVYARTFPQQELVYGESAKFMTLEEDRDNKAAAAQAAPTPATVPPSEAPARPWGPPPGFPKGKP